MFPTDIARETNLWFLYNILRETTLKKLASTRANSYLKELLTLLVSKAFINIFSARYAQTGYRVKETMDIYIRPWRPWTFIYVHGLLEELSCNMSVLTELINTVIKGSNTLLFKML